MTVVLDGTIFGLPFPKTLLIYLVIAASHRAAELSKSDCSFNIILIVLDSLLHGCLKSLENLSREHLGKIFFFPFWHILNAIDKYGTVLSTY